MSLFNVLRSCVLFSYVEEYDMGSMFFSSAPFSTWKQILPFKIWFTNILRIYPVIAYCVTEFEAVFFSVIFAIFVLLPIALNTENTFQIYEPRHEVSNNVVCATSIRAV